MLLAGLALAAGTASRASSVIGVWSLPPEAVQTLRLIDSGGPFPYRRDGITFQNRERLLPERGKAYYREYTVPTPGEKTRGARRIITGGDPPEVYYYTDDHYKSFQRIAR